MLRLEPAWVPRTFMVPGRRLRLHPDDLYALGGHRGGINERWFSSTTKADNGILNLARACRPEPGTGSQVDPRIRHAPGSLVTYEPQVNSDVFAMFQSEVDGRIVPWELMTKDVPKAHHDDLDYLVEMLDWDANVNPQFATSNRVFPCPVRPFAESEVDGYREQWVC